jgi:hypothetical protein
MPARTYRIAPEFRRCCWYVLGATPVLAAISLGVGWLSNRGVLEMVAGATTFGLLTLALLAALRWELRVDEQGIVRRRLFFLSDSWTWADFASGRIRKLSHSLDDPQRPWWRRILCLDLLSDHERQQLLAELNAHYQLPPEPVIPNALTIRYGFRRSVRLSDRGIRAVRGRSSTEYPWESVRNIHITRLDPLRRDFCSLLIVLPDQELELNYARGNSPVWSGPKPEVVDGFLLGHAAYEIVDTCIAGEPCRNRAHLERQIRGIEKTRRQFTTIMAVLLTVFIGALVWTAITEGVILALVLGGIYAPLYASMVLFVSLDQRKKLRDLKRALGALPGDRASAADPTG